jgi:hypothetical protein
MYARYARFASTRGRVQLYEVLVVFSLESTVSSSRGSLAYKEFMQNFNLRKSQAVILK